jgi:hypothetical protein
MHGPHQPSVHLLLLQPHRGVGSALAAPRKVRRGALFSSPAGSVRSHSATPAVNARSRCATEWKRFSTSVRSAFLAYSRRLQVEALVQPGGSAYARRARSGLRSGHGARARELYELTGPDPDDSF